MNDVDVLFGKMAAKIDELNERVRALELNEVSDMNDFLLEVAKGKVPGHSVMRKFGDNSDVGTSYENIWPLGNSPAVLWRTSSAALSVASTSASDAAAGVGARSVEVSGIDGNGAAATVTAILSGTTPVSCGTWRRVNRIRVASAGTSNANVGNIYVGSGAFAAGVPALIDSYMEAGDGSTLQLFYTVPDGYTLFVYMLNYFCDASKGWDINVKVRMDGGNFGNVVYIGQRSHLYQAGESYNYNVPIRVEAMDDFWVEAKCDIGSSHFAAEVIGVLVDNNYL